MAEKKTINSRLVMCTKTSNEWATYEEVPLKGEICIDSELNKIKIGDGINSYNTLPYLIGEIDEKVITKEITEEDEKIPTSKAVNTFVNNKLSEIHAMTFKGKVNSSSPLPEEKSIGDTYIVTENGNYNNQDAVIGDFFIYNDEDEWVFVPAGNEAITEVKYTSTKDEINITEDEKTGKVIFGDVVSYIVATALSDVAIDEKSIPTAQATVDYINSKKFISETDTLILNGNF